MHLEAQLGGSRVGNLSSKGPLKGSFKGPFKGSFKGPFKGSLEGPCKSRFEGSFQGTLRVP